MLGWIVLYILIGNTDDHSPNHAVFWDGQHVQLAPAYDLCPQLRTGEANQAWTSAEHRPLELPDPVEQPPDHRASCARLWVDSSGRGRHVDRQVDIIRTQWQDVVASAQLTQRDEQSLRPTDLEQLCAYLTTRQAWLFVSHLGRRTPSSFLIERFLDNRLTDRERGYFG